MQILRLTTILFTGILFAQSTIVTVETPTRLSAHPGGSAQSTISVKVAPGFHANSNAPADSFLIPLSLTWSSGALQSQKATFPKPEMQKLGFSEKPVSVFTGEFAIVTQFRIDADAAPGVSVVTGKLHYQACDNKSCRPPATLTIALPIEITKN